MPRAASARSSEAWNSARCWFDRRGREAVAVDHDQRRGAADPLRQLGARLVGQRAAEIGALQEDRLVGRARRDLEHPEPVEQLRIDLGHHGVLGGGVIGAEAQHRVGVVARAGAADRDARRRRRQDARHHRRIVGLADVDAAIGRDQQGAAVSICALRRRGRPVPTGQRLAHHRLDARAIDGGRRRLHRSTLGSPARAVSLPSRMRPISSSHASNSGAGRNPNSWRSAAPSWNDVDW